MNLPIKPKSSLFSAPITIMEPSFIPFALYPQPKYPNSPENMHLKPKLPEKQKHSNNQTRNAQNQT